MLEFWRNPEFVRHVRAELRPMRALSAAIIVVVLCLLLGLGCWSLNRDHPERIGLSFYGTLLVVQFLLLSMFCATACGQGISREREMKTHDFLRTTRLTAAELMVGKVLGEPVLGYFVVGCSLPVSLVTGVLAGYSPIILLKTYLLLLVFSLFIGVAALWISLQAERSNVAGLAVIVLVLLGTSAIFASSPFPGFAALSPYPALSFLYNISRDAQLPTIFGRPISYGWVSLLLYSTMGAWFALMLVRNFKRELPEIRLLSRWQALGLVAYLNLLFYAFLKHELVAVSGELTPTAFCRIVLLSNALILFGLGISLLTPYEDLKVWRRHRAAGQESYWSERGLAWPWLLLLAAIAYSMLAAQAGFFEKIPLGSWHLGAAAFKMCVLLIFIVRDTLFLQYCCLTRTQRPMAMGMLYLFLYYFAVAIFSMVVNVAAPAAVPYFYALQPFYVLGSDDLRPAMVGAAVQIPVICVLLWAVSRRLRATAR